MNNLVKAIEAGIFNNTTAERMNVLENQKSMLSDALLAEQNRKKCDLTLNDIVRFLDSLIGDTNDPDTRRKLLDFLVDKIYIYPDKMVLTFYYSDNWRELPFEDTVEFIENRQRLIDMIDNPAPCGGKEKNADFFP
ncbi:MAG: hypothetical protein HDT38_00385 [Clostridiales bacterium]|nr:hypothetical protein [Clostridiales bacterium]